MVELLSINHCNHRIIAFVGFSPQIINSVLNEFISADRFTYAEFTDLLIYKFAKDIDESLLKMVFAKAFHNEKLKNSKYERERKQVSYTHAHNKKSNHSLSTTDYLEQDSVCAERESGKKKTRIIFKLTCCFKIIGYNMLPASALAEIKEALRFIDELSQKKKHIASAIENKRENMPKVK